MKYRCLIVDDERPALKLLAAYISKVPHLELIKACDSSTEALSVLGEKEIDILFLDIQMPDLTGLELLGALSMKPAVVLTTAYRDYALEGFKYAVTDYLVKPFSFERFVQAQNKAKDLIDLKRKAKEGFDQVTSVKTKKDSSVLDEPFFVKTTHKLEKIALRDVLYVESMREYIGVFTKEKRYVIHQSMTAMEGKLPDEHFLRVHRSYIVAFDQIEAINGNTIHISDKIIPIGGSYRKSFFDRVELL